MRKYKAGQQIATLDQFVKIYNTKQPIYFRNKYLTYTFYENWFLRKIVEAIEAGVVSEVETIKNGI